MISKIEELQSFIYEFQLQLLKVCSFSNFQWEEPNRSLGCLGPSKKKKKPQTCWLVNNLLYKTVFRKRKEGKVVQIWCIYEAVFILVCLLRSWFFGFLLLSSSTTELAVLLCRIQKCGIYHFLFLPPTVANVDRGALTICHSALLPFAHRCFFLFLLCWRFHN